MFSFVVGATAIAFAQPRTAGEELFTDDPVAITPTDLPRNTRIERDVAFGPDAAQRMDIYLPPTPRDNAAIVVMVHGGAWLFGDKSARAVVAHKASHWLAQGDIFVSVNYRLVPKADPLEQASDVARAIGVVQARARAWGADPSQLILMGHSAGAHLVALLAADPAIARAHGVTPWRGTVALDSAAMDIEQIMRRPHLRFYDRAFGADPAYWAKASPIHRLTGRPAPILLVCSSRRPDSCAQAKNFADRARALGGRAAVLPQPLSHRDINANLGLPGDYTDEVDQFIRSVIKPGGGP